jgi:hypothetical protein
MLMTTRTVVLFVTIALATGGAAWGVHSLITSAGGAGTDYGLDTNGNGKFDWLVVEADVTFPQAGTWDISADLSSSNPPPSGSCGYPSPPPLPLLSGGPAYPQPATYPIAYVYERYFFPAGSQIVRMAFAGTDIARAGMDGPYAVHARLSLGGVPYMTLRPLPDPGYVFIEWNYTTRAYLASDFEPPIRPAYFTGGHTDSAVDLDADGLADFLELRADVHVNLAGRYSLNGYLSKGNGTDVVRLIAYAYRDFNLTTADTDVLLRFRGDQIRQANVDGPWDFHLTLYGPIDVTYGNATPQPLPAGGILPPQPAYYPETLCGTTSAYRAAEFDATIEVIRFTGSFEAMTPDANGDGTYDALVIRAQVEVFVSSSFDLAGVLRAPAGSADLAQTLGQACLSDGLQWVTFSFPGPEIRKSGVDGPYEATLSITPGVVRIDPTATYTTQAYKATDFDP